MCLYNTLPSINYYAKVHLYLQYADPDQWLEITPVYQQNTDDYHHPVNTDKSI